MHSMAAWCAKIHLNRKLAEVAENLSQMLHENEAFIAKMCKALSLTVDASLLLLP